MKRAEVQKKFCQHAFDVQPCTLSLFDHNASNQFGYNTMINRKNLYVGNAPLDIKVRLDTVPFAFEGSHIVRLGCKLFIIKSPKVHLAPQLPYPAMCLPPADSCQM